MDITIQPRKLNGIVRAIPSKSHVHRMLIGAALSDKPTFLHCDTTNEDIEATVSCLNAIGAKIIRSDSGYHITPIQSIPDNAELNCCESGSTLRFMLPVVAALGVEAIFHLTGRLPERPLSPLWEEMERMGCMLSRPSKSTLKCSGKLRAGTYTIHGGVSSQFITGLLFALPLLPGQSQLLITGTLESKSYVELTLQVLKQFGICADQYKFDGQQRYISKGEYASEGDWSNAAFFLAAQAMGNHVVVDNLQSSSVQGDRQIVELLNNMDQFHVISGENIPDLIPILAVTAACTSGAKFTNIHRLRLKESDRISSVFDMLTALGAKVAVDGDELSVYPSNLQSGTVDSKNDHRIAMAAAIAATVATGPVTILNAECVKKSYPDFWKVYTDLGGYYEQYIR